MYICDKNLTSAINKINNHPNPKTCTTETNFFPFIWYVWGNSKKELNNFKNRFDSINAGCHFFYHTKENKFLTNQPKLKEPARHTQGLKHDLVVTRISLCL